MTKPDDTIRVVIPLNVRKRNGRPKILPPENIYEQETRTQDPHILKALGRAWAWRRRLDNGEASTVSDIAREEDVTDRFVSRTMRLAYLDPDVLERLLVNRQPPSVSWQDLVGTTYLPWLKQNERVFSPTPQHSRCK